MAEATHEAVAEKKIPNFAGVFANEEIAVRLIELIDQGLSRGEIPRILNQEFETDINPNHVAGARNRLKKLRAEGKIADTINPILKRVAKPKETPPPKLVAESTKEPLPPAEESPPPASNVKAPEADETEEKKSQRLPNGKHITTLTVTNQNCRWPIGDPVDDEFHYCGRKPTDRSPYCEEHTRRSYQPNTQRRASRA